MLDFTTYREPAGLFDIDEIPLERDDILLHNHSASISRPFKRGILSVAPHIASTVPGPLSYRDSLAYGCHAVTGFDARTFQLDVGEKSHAQVDVVLQAMTGAGKSLLFALPIIANPTRFAIVASPLNILQSGMAETFETYGLSSIVYNAEARNDQTTATLRSRNFHFLFTHPENLVKSGPLHSFLVDPIWASKCALLCLDEAHLVAEWGLSGFRPAYAELGQLRSFFSAPILAVSATLAPSTVTALAELLHLGPDYEYVNLGNARDNLFWEVREVGGSLAGIPSLRFLLPPIVTLQTVIPQTIIFVPGRPLAHRVANYLRRILPDAMPSNTIVPLHAIMRSRRKQHVLDLFAAGDARIMICTTVAALGRDFRNVVCVVGFQLPGSIEEWVQEAGRGARDPDLACHAILLVERAAYNLKSSPSTDPESDEDSDSDFDSGEKAKRPGYPEDAKPEMFTRSLAAVWRSFIAPLSSFRAGDPCRCEISFRFFGNPGDLKKGLCDVCRTRGEHNARYTPTLILDLTLPAGASRPQAEPVAQTRTPPRRKGATLFAADRALKSWRLALWKRLFLDSGFPLEALMPDTVLETISGALKLFHVDDLKRLDLNWPLLPQFAGSVLDIMHRVQTDEAAEKVRIQKEKSDRKSVELATEAAAKKAQAEKLAKARSVFVSNSDIRRTMAKPAPPQFMGAAEGTRSRMAAPSVPARGTELSTTDAALPAPSAFQKPSPRKRKSRADSPACKENVLSDTQDPPSALRAPKRKRTASPPRQQTPALKELTNSPRKRKRPASAAQPQRTSARLAASLTPSSSTSNDQ